MNAKEKQLAAKFLEMASDEFSNHGCNDVENSVWKGWSKEERMTFVKEYHEWNGDPEEFDSEPIKLHYRLSEIERFNNHKNSHLPYCVLVAVLYLKSKFYEIYGK